MKREIIISGKPITYDLTYKKVKNINLRIKSDGQVCLSANKRVPAEFVDDFVKSKGEFVLRALEKYEKRQKTAPKMYYTEEELKSEILRLCEKVYPYFESRGTEYPTVKFRKMTSRWGSCHPVRKILTFSTYLQYAPPRCVEYVVKHEFTHFLVANHSAKFYAELSNVCPDWKKTRKTLREIPIPRKEK